VSAAAAACTGRYQQQQKLRRQVPGCTSHSGRSPELETA
jgi:hypothetical protein